MAEEWNIALKLLNEWLMVIASVAQALGRITDYIIVKLSVRLNINISSSIQLLDVDTIVVPYRPTSSLLSMDDSPFHR